ncbi:uncharacterized protein E0L32_006852 [Thyridium curvatum]|uniref:Tetratricopeptide repeat protein 15 n=1 Tax=Thyridium curvatum TaxID=1093900 RepID=A0A507B716_9PEZI|nr:uncharacterized protein E0L32_006852 [Thyridium curvatum]TPX12440.1 hypothetical protein E0L32_006852 [Thyridium curvatum]
MAARADVKTATRPRSSTKGPLDVDDNPLMSPVSASSAARLTPSQSPSRAGRGPASPLPRSQAASPAPPRAAVAPPKDFSYLLRPEVYHPLTSLTVPAAFHNSPHQPSPDASIEDLLARGHFRAAAIAATHALTGTGTGTAAASPPDPSDHGRILGLLYTRLACLTLVDATALAAQEARALEDLGSAYYTDEVTGAHLAPWELRVLHVRLQSIGFGDPRRSVMGYYDLAREARASLAAAAARHDNSARELWRGRLGELGVRVAGALVEMDDLAGAAAHLASLRDAGDGRMAMARALLWLHLGDVAAARRCVPGGEGEAAHGKIVAALCDMADGEYASALEGWKEVKEEVDDEMVGVNMAVCLLYVGRLEEGRKVLEELVAAGYSSHTLLFNLTTVYELCTDRPKTLKMDLAQKLADMEPTNKGWEKTNADFKL